jgi:hypothetical protein
LDFDDELTEVGFALFVFFGGFEGGIEGVETFGEEMRELSDAVLSLSDMTAASFHLAIAAVKVEPSSTTISTVEVVPPSTTIALVILLLTSALEGSARLSRSTVWSNGGGGAVCVAENA